MNTMRSRGGGRKGSLLEPDNSCNSELGREEEMHMLRLQSDEGYLEGQDLFADKKKLTGR